MSISKPKNCKEVTYNYWRRAVRPFFDCLKWLRNTTCCKKYGRADMYNEIDGADEKERKDLIDKIGEEIKQDHAYVCFGYKFYVIVGLNMLFNIGISLYTGFHKMDPIMSLLGINVSNLLLMWYENREIFKRKKTIVRYRGKFEYYVRLPAIVLWNLYMENDIYWDSLFIW